MSAIFYHDTTQLEAIERTRALVKTPEQVQTEIAPYDAFWIAEDYHQKYRLRGKAALADELKAFYPGNTDFVGSTAAARINGYLAGHGTVEQLEREIDRLGLSAAGKDLLRSAR